MKSSQDTGTLNLVWSQALVNGLVAAGVTHAVISPGSRSTPLALAMLRQSALRCEIGIDERCAAFFALGIAKASRRPVLVLATSGTAVANWLPALVEASLAGVPIIFISADRPPELHGLGANQTVPQAGLFDTYVRASHPLGVPEVGFNASYLHALAARVVAQTSWPHPGPVHINQPFREPLVPENPVDSAPVPTAIQVSQPFPQPESNALTNLLSEISGQPGLIVCGELVAENGLPEALTAVARYLDCPILAEPTSGLRFGPHRRTHLLRAYNLWLDNLPHDAKPAWILRFGAAPVTRRLQSLLACHTGTMALVDPWPRWNDPFSRLTHLLHASPLATCREIVARTLTPCPAGWNERWQTAERSTLKKHHAEPYAQLIPDLIRALPENCPVFVGNSLAIRALDSHSGSDEKSLIFFANRGASGIDGNVSTALGIAAWHGRVVALLGDLTFQHDMGGLVAAQGRNAVFVVVNNGGGRIFEHLPQVNLPEFEQGWLTPQKLDFQAAAATFGIMFARTSVGKTFSDAINGAIAKGGAHLIEVTF